jgi:predicted peptidase
MGPKSNVITGIVIYFWLLSLLLTPGKVECFKKRREVNRLRVVQDPRFVPYELFLPNKLSRFEKAPVMVFLHGRGESGSFSVTNKQSLPLQLLTNNTLTDTFPFIVIVPQCPEDCVELNVWTEDTLKATSEIVKDVISIYNGDPSRVYLAGQSMGGNGAWLFASQQRNLFAAVLVICGYGGSHEDSRLIAQNVAKSNMPAALVHSVDDSVIPVSASDIMVRYLYEFGHVKVRYDRYEHAPGPPIPEFEMLVGHGVYEIAFRDASIYKWLLEQRCETCSTDSTEWHSLYERPRHIVHSNKANMDMDM